MKRMRCSDCLKVWCIFLYEMIWQTCLQCCDAASCSIFVRWLNRVKVLWSSLEQKWRLILKNRSQEIGHLLNRSNHRPRSLQENELVVLGTQITKWHRLHVFMLIVYVKSHLWCNSEFLYWKWFYCHDIDSITLDFVAKAGAKIIAEHDFYRKFCCIVNLYVLGFY